MSDTGFFRIHNILDGKVQFKINKIPNFTPPRARASRVVRRTPEVMVKVSGFGRGSAHVKSHLDYVCRNAKLELENERGEVISGKEAVRDLHREWMQDRGRRRSNTRDTTNVILSMPPKTDEKKMKKAVREFALEQFGDNHQYVWVMHSDEKHPHAHLTIKNLGYDGSRLNIAKGDPQKWRELFAEKLRYYGIDAEATARAPRGVVKKPVRQPIYHMRKDGRTPRTDKAKVKEVIQDVAAAPKKPKPWERKILDRQTAVRKEWVQAAKELSSSNSSPADRKLSADILRYVKSMPDLKTERQEIQAKLAKGRAVPDKDQQQVQE